MSNLTPGAAMAALLQAKTPEEEKKARENLDEAHDRLVEKAAAQGISMTFQTRFSNNSGTNNAPTAQNPQ